MSDIIAESDNIATVNCYYDLCNHGAMSIKEEFTNRFRSACEHKFGPKPNQTELAKRFDVSQATVSEWWTAKKMPALEKLIHIAIVLDVALEWLGTGRGDREVQQLRKKQIIFSEDEKNVIRKIIDLIEL